MTILEFTIDGDSSTNGSYAFTCSSDYGGSSCRQDDRPTVTWRHAGRERRESERGSIGEVA